jgi:hypothetical protein
MQVVRRRRETAFAVDRIDDQQCVDGKSHRFLIINYKYLFLNNIYIQ